MFLLRSRALTSRALWWLACLALTGCGDDVSPGVAPLMDLDGTFFEAPFPSAHRDRGDGTLVVGDFPTGDNPLLEQLVELLEEGSTGYSLNAAIYLPFDGPIDPKRLPESPAASLESSATVFLVNVEKDSDAYGERIPIETHFKAKKETYTPANTLVVLPYQGAVLAPSTTYAVIVTRALGDDQGRALFRAPLLEELLTGDPIAGPHAESMNAAFAELNAWRADAGGPYLEDIAGATVFTTGDPLTQMQRWQKQVGALPAEPATDVARVESYDNFCAVRATITLPVFQRGPKPYADYPDGQLAVNGDGLLVEQERDTMEVMISIPHGEMPSDGFPLVLYAAGAEGRARQVIDRTAIADDPSEGGDGPPGQGPAKHFATRNVAAFGFPAPLAWDRHPTGAGGLLDFWNVANLGSFRDVIRQGVLDFATLVAVVETLTIDAAACPEATTTSGAFHFDESELFLFGHSTGSTIGSAVIALEPSIRAAILSGAGGSWIYNVALAKSPFDLATISHLLLDYDDDDQVDVFDPALTLFQTALESIEVMSWGRATVQHPLSGVGPKQLLLIEGVTDTYHLPRMVNAYAMSVGLDLVEPEVEPTAREDYALVGRGVLAAPAIANVDVGLGLTAVTIQRAQNEEDGHYVPFELDDVKYRYSCFVASAVADDIATVPPPNDDPAAPCP